MSKTDLPFDSLMKFTSFIKLETTNDNLIRKVSQVLFTEDRIIIVDRDVSQSISVYDMTGKILNKIGKLGQGPNEYAFLWITNFCIKKILLWCPYKLKRYYNIKMNYTAYAKKKI